MIPTRYKSKLSHLMSFPIRSSVLSTALEDVPQINELSVAFFDSCQDPQKLENPCQILSINYSYRRVNLTTENKNIERNKYGSKWEITVYPVPRACVSIVKNRLDDEGFDKIRQWLYLHKDATSKDGHCWLRLLYDMDANLLNYKQLDNLFYLE
jgi:hypothetical protein